MLYCVPLENSVGTTLSIHRQGVNLIVAVSPHLLLEIAGDWRRLAEIGQSVITIVIESSVVRGFYRLSFASAPSQVIQQSPLWASKWGKSASTAPIKISVLEMSHKFSGLCFGIGKFSGELQQISLWC